MREAMGNAYVPGSVALGAVEEALIARRVRALGPAYRLQYERPLHIVRGEGVHLYDADGNVYLDAYNNVPSVGHGHPRVVEALARQAATLNTHTRYLHTNILDYAERLLATMPAAIGNVMFTCTGSEANDLAGRIAQAHTGGAGFIVTKYAYHGVTEVVSRLSPCLGEGVEQGPNVRLVPAPSSRGDVGEAFAAGVRAAIADFRAHGIQPAALVVDTVFTSDGNHVDPTGFLGPAVDAIRAAGGVFVADEVQPGFGRTGSHFWGFARHGLVPDLVTMGKPMGNGHPMGAVAARPELVESFAKRVRYFNTFGGNPVSCAVGLAVLDVLADEGLMGNAADVGAYLRDGLDALAARWPILGERRIAGLACAVDIVDEAGLPDAAAATQIVNGLRDRRVLISISGIEHATLKIRPPLVFRREHADQLLGTLEAVLASR